MGIEEALEKSKMHEYEAVIWREKFSGDPSKWTDACREAAHARRQLLEKETGRGLEEAGRCYTNTCNAEKLTTGIEQKIGSAAVPLGVSSPLKVNGEFAKGEFYIPLATNEAALVAGLNRGRKAVNAAGGVSVRVTRDMMTRAPLVEAPSIDEASSVADEIRSKGALFDRMKKAAESESKVTRLLEIQPFQLGRRLHLRFVFQTGDSMGMNSATKYASAGVKALLDSHRGLKLLSLTGNMCMDKKAGHVNVLLGRGKSVEVEVLVPSNVLKDVFGVEPEAAARLCVAKSYEGSALAGTVTGFNLNAANAVAAVFIATGQDAAQIVESATCFTRAQSMEGGLLFGVTLPCLEIATVGGGTDYGTAKECLRLLGCDGPGKNPGDNAKKLAEIIAAAVLCQELNLLCALSNGHELADSHMKLARGKS